MKTMLILLVACWPALFFAQSSNEIAASRLINQGEQLLNGKGADSIALVCAQNALAILRPNKTFLLEGRARLLAGNALYRLGSPEDATPLLQKALKLFRQAKNDSLVLNTLVALSRAFGDRESPQLDSALACLTEALPTALRRRDTLQLARAYINIANIRDEWEDYDTALVYNRLCDTLLRRKAYDTEKGENYYNMGNTLLNLYIEKGEERYLSEAEICLQKAVAIFYELGDRAREADARNAAGTAALYSENFPQSKKELNKSLELCIVRKDSIGMLNAYYNLATLAETEGKLPEATEALRRLAILMEKSGTAGDRSFVREQLSNNELKISKTLIDNKIHILEEKNKNEKNRQATLVLISVFATLATGGIFYFRQKMRANRLLMQQKEKLHIEQLDNLFKAQEIEFIRARLEGEELGKQRIARKIHDGVGSLLVSAKWNLESALGELSDREKKVADRLHENIRLQDESYSELRRVVHELEQERIPWWQDLQKFCERLTNTGKTRIRFYTHNLKEGIDGATGEEARLVTQELVANALKHAGASEINVQINRIDHILSIVVEDNGKGFNPDTASYGVGLHSIQERVGRLGGSISFETGKGAGTNIFIDVPLKPANIFENSSQFYAAN